MEWISGEESQRVGILVRVHQKDKSFFVKYLNVLQWLAASSVFQLGYSSFCFLFAGPGIELRPLRLPGKRFFFY